MRALNNRVPPPLVAGLFMFIMWAVSFVVPALEINHGLRLSLSMLVVVAGIVFCIAAIVSFKQVKTTANPLKPETATALVSTGIYAISRNPMYVGLGLFLLGWAVYLSSVWVTIGVVGFVLYMNHFQIEPEERVLTDLFGAEFISYQTKVRRWL